ncbi:MAG TPA: bifunctional diguanylate cyclase/phosphodiesterase [Mycobacteriales bacterium]|nr:bifunctional diguanylate cyclase/phosphodiesterase [Mycobacteriales bacterium]
MLEVDPIMEREPLDAFLETLGRATGADLVQFTPLAAGAMPELWSASGTADPNRLAEHARAWLAIPPAHEVEDTMLDGVRLVIARVGDRSSIRGALTLFRPEAAGPSAVDLAATLCAAVIESTLPIPSRLQRRLDDLVTAVATRLMPVSAATVAEAYQWTVSTLGEFFSVDATFLRRNEHERGVSVLVAEWPYRQAPDPDPLREVPFENSDPVFAAVRDLREPLLIRPDAASADYQQRVQQGTGLQAVSLATVPLLRGAITEGVIGFIKIGDRSWSDAELGALRAISSLLVQLQARIEAEERLAYSAYHDELTGLPNRRAFLERLHGLLAPEQERPVALLFLDLDRLKAMNDFLGHGAGDQFLVAIAARLRDLNSYEDFSARLGGDEFVVLAPGVGEMEDALVVARRILDSVTVPIDVGGHPVSRSASIGVAIGHPGETNVDELILYADVALLEAKARGRSAIQPFNEEIRAKIDTRAQIELHLSSAIADGAFRLHYQPEFDLRSGALVAVEALLRWEHPVRGLLSAEEFIDIAEETNTIIELGRWVLAEACQQVVRWRRDYPDLDLMVRVNISPAQLISKDMVPTVMRTLSATGLPGHALCLEITERVVLPDLDQVLSALGELHGLGVVCAIDDFGTGYSSLSQLKSLPVDTLKIDRGFVAGVGRDPGDTAIVESIARLARTFRLGLVAEGVETAQAVQDLIRIGCYRAQGNLLGRPLPPHEIEPVLSTGRWSVGPLAANQ